MSKIQFFSKNIGIFFLAIGLFSFGISIDYQSSMALVVGATLILWGGILLYIKDENYVKTILLEKTFNDLYSIINELYNNLSIIGKPIYFFEGSFEGLDLVYIKLNTSEEDYITLIAPGQELHRAFEKALDVNFSSEDLFNISAKLEKIMIGDFNLASSISLTNIDDNTIQATIVDNIYTKNPSEKVIWEKIGDPLTSALACIITRSKAKNLVIDAYSTNKRDNKIIFSLIN